MKNIFVTLNNIDPVDQPPLITLWPRYCVSLDFGWLWIPPHSILLSKTWECPSLEQNVYKEELLLYIFLITFM